MRVIIPILLITIFGLVACNEDPATDQTSETPQELPSKNPYYNKNRSGQEAEQHTGFVNKSENTAQESENKAAKQEDKPVKPVKIEALKSAAEIAKMIDAEAKPHHNPKPQAPLSPADSAKLYKIDDVVKFVEGERNKSFDRTDLRLNIITDDDFFFYTSKDKKIQEALLSFKKEDKNGRHYFYFKDGQFIFYRKLRFLPTEIVPYSRETIVFFENNEIFEVQERKVDLKVGEGPNRIFAQPFTRPDVDKKAMKEEIETLWGILFKEIERHELGLDEN